MKLPGLRCSQCGTQTPDREVGDTEVCQCGSRMCLLRSAQICVTTNRPRSGTFDPASQTGKGQERPQRDRMLHSPAVKK